MFQQTFGANRDDWFCVGSDCIARTLLDCVSELVQQCATRVCINTRSFFVTLKVIQTGKGGLCTPFHIAGVRFVARSMGGHVFRSIVRSFKQRPAFLALPLHAIHCSMTSSLSLSRHVFPFLRLVETWVSNVLISNLGKVDSLPVWNE